MFTDSASSQAQIHPDICGDKEIYYQINSITTLDLTGGNNSPVTFSPNTIDKIYGTFSATQDVKLQNYNVIEKYDMNVTILALVEPVVTNQTYNLTGNKFEFQVHPYTVLPESFNGEEIVKNTKTAYFVSGKCDVPTTIDINDACLSLIPLESWLSYDQETFTFTVQTKNKYLLGTYKIIVVQNFLNFAQVVPFVFFTLTLEQVNEPHIPDLYFSPSLAN